MIPHRGFHRIGVFFAAIWMVAAMALVGTGIYKHRTMCKEQPWECDAVVTKEAEWKQTRQSLPPGFKPHNPVTPETVKLNYIFAWGCVIVAIVSYCLFWSIGWIVAGFRKD